MIEEDAVCDVGGGILVRGDPKDVVGYGEVSYSGAAEVVTGDCCDAVGYDEVCQDGVGSFG